MPVSWNEIETRAFQFAGRWKGETYEKGSSQLFWSEFLTMFDVDHRRHGAFFEYAIKKLSGKQGFIDLFWPGKLIAEQKSAGKDLDKANFQALEYLDTMPDHDLPQFIVVSDFATFQVMELSTGKKSSFTLAQLPDRVKVFGFLRDETSITLAEEDPVNRKAAEGMARLHNLLRDSRYVGHDLELLLVRLVFCLFADDAQIFEKGSFQRYLQQRTRADGSDLGPQLGQIFEVLNTPDDERQTTLDQDLQAFPYINGGLFERTLRIPSCTSQMRRELLDAASLNWREVSPAIFGSMFQGVLDEAQRRNLGAHYTSERNILRVIKPLFLDDLYAEYATARRGRTTLERFHRKLATLNFLDPACGCGNFLVITYRELRRLEHKVVQDLVQGQRIIDIPSLIRVNVNQLHGIEIEEFPSRIAQTALWLTDHQMNLEASAQLGQQYVRLPLTTSANIVHANALTTDWKQVISPNLLTYILGNPPFVGSKMMTATMREEVLAQFPGVRGAGTLDFVSAWYAKSLAMMEANPAIRTALVSTNSITQGEQVGVLWRFLQADGLTINFAHRTFKWSNEATNNAAVYCVIVGFSLQRTKDRTIFTYPDIRGDPVPVAATTINPYLIDAPTVLVLTRQRPISPVPEIGIGNLPITGQYYFFTPSEKQQFLKLEPSAEQFFRRWLGSEEYINGVERWYLWLGEVSPAQLRSMPEVLKRIEGVRELRLKSKRKQTVAIANSPTRFQVENIPHATHIVIPKVSSERRDYIPVGLVEPGSLVSDLMFILPSDSLYHFSVLTSAMHMAWVRAVCGRLKSDYRYSKDIVYNNFPWPDTSAKQWEAIEQLGQSVLDARSSHPESTLADLYDPRTMPFDLRKAHNAVDRAVDRLYAPRRTFSGDTDRLVVLFNRYQQLTEG